VAALEDSTQLVQAQKLAAWNEAARRIAHEIKNPLTPIQLSAERIAKKFGQDEPAIDEGCRIIVSEVGSSSGWWTSSRASPGCRRCICATRSSRRSSSRRRASTAT